MYIMFGYPKTFLMSETSFSNPVHFHKNCERNLCKWQQMEAIQTGGVDP